MAPIDPQLTAWAAGLFEGEGCIEARWTNSAALTLGMTDPDVVERFRTIVGVGTIYVRRPQKNRWKPLHAWHVGSKWEVRLVLEAFLPYLGARRRQKAEAVLLRLTNCRGRGTSTHCLNGHPYDAADAAGARICRPCRNARQRVRRARPKRVA